MTGPVTGKVALPSIVTIWVRKFIIASWTHGLEVVHIAINVTEHAHQFVVIVPRSASHSDLLVVTFVASAGLEDKWILRPQTKKQQLPRTRPTIVVNNVSAVDEIMQEIALLLAAMRSERPSLYARYINVTFGIRVARKFVALM